MKKLQSIFIRLLALTVLSVIGAFANTVPLDTTFNGTGYSIQSAAPSPEQSFGNSFAIQPDGKIVIGGITNDSQSNRKFAVMRLNANGTLDTSFGTGGSTVSAVGVTADTNKLILQPDGKILLLGNSWTELSTGYNITLVRYTASGALDTTFNGTGIVTRNINGTSSDYGADMALQPDGKIIVAGNTSANSQDDFVLMRYNTDGTLDTSFNGTGILTVSDPANDSVSTVILLADGKILVGGARNNGGNNKFLLMRFNADATPDTSFGTGGSTVTNGGNGNTGIGTMALQSDGKIVGGGSGYIVRYKPNGILDASFAGSGITTIPTFTEMYRITIAAGDKILIASKFGANAGVTRLTDNGYSDTNFNGGNRNIFVSGSNCIAADVSVQSDGKIVLGGYCTQNNIPKFAVFRVQEIKTKRFLDFDGNESTEMSLYRPSDGLWSIYYTSTAQTSSTTLGSSADRPASADFTGDGRADIAVFRPSTGEWFVLRSETNTLYSYPFGTSGDVPVPADYDGDDKADIGVFRPSTSEWWILKSSGGITVTTFGLSSDKPVPSDYDGDFKTDIAIYRPSSGEWWISKSSDNNVYAFEFGTSTDKPVPGDYTGDGKTDAAFWRPSTGEWFILRSEDYSYYSSPFGLSDDLPTPGNYSGDGRFDLVVYRPSTNTWYVQPTGGNYFYRIFGAPGDIPVPNAFVP